MKTLDQYLNKLSKKERAAIASGARIKIAAYQLQLVREAAGMTQKQVATRLGVTQATLSRMERRADVRISNMRRYVEALGGTLQVRAVFPGRARAIELGCK
jgi:transcriptional regulator with XRE-family HTH domain